MIKRLFFIFLIGLFFNFLIYPSPIQARASYLLFPKFDGVTLKNGDVIKFDLIVYRYKAGEKFLIGAKYDPRKLKFIKVEAGDIGPVEWKAENVSENERRIILKASPINRDIQQMEKFAVLHFQIDDKTNERNEAGYNSTELCTLFTPEEMYDDSFPSNTPVPTPIPTPTNTPILTNTPSSYTPTATKPEDRNNLIKFEPIDKSKTCIPLVKNGSPADKMDWLVVGVNYTPEQEEKFFSEVKLAIQRLAESNLSEFKEEVLNKMNWFVLNPRVAPEYRKRKFTDEMLRPYLAKVLPLCSYDRYVVLVGNADFLSEGNMYIGGEAAFYIGFIYPAGGLYMTEFNTFAHEWGHAAVGLLDEYYTGQWVVGREENLAFNCSLEGSDLNPEVDPCPAGKCTPQADSEIYKKPCKKWDCSLRNCSSLEKQLFATAGCYPRCSIREAYRPNKISIMDAMVSGAGPEILKFNGPSLYAIISYFSRYR